MMKIAGLHIKVERNAVYTFGVLAVIFSAGTALIGLLTGDSGRMSILEILGVGLAAATFHFVAQLIHMIGHALAAWSAGHPMSGMHFLYVLAMSLYPADEPPLPARVHIWRSLGGVIAFALLFFAVLLFWSSVSGAAQWPVRYLAGWMLLDSGLLFAVSALISDGVLFILGKQWLTRPAESEKLLG